MLPFKTQTQTQFLTPLSPPLSLALESVLFLALIAFLPNKQQKREHRSFSSLLSLYIHHSVLHYIKLISLLLGVSLPFLLVFLLHNSMSKWEKSTLQERNKHHPKNPSFSSTLLDEIYRSITIERGEEEEDLSFYGDRYGSKQHGQSALEGEGKMSSLRRACFVEKWMENKVNEEALISQRQQQRRSNLVEELDRKKVCSDRFDHYHQHEAIIPFSTTSSSSDSSFGGFSSSETESNSSFKPRSSCFAPPRPKPVRTSVSSRATKSSNTQHCGHKESSVLEAGDCRRSGDSKFEHGSFKSKSRALKIYSNLKSLKQPVSPGMRLASFINSLFVKESSKKKNRSSNSVEGYDYKERSYKSEQTSTCSSATSFSRSCLMSRNASTDSSPTSGTKLQNGVKRSVRFYPVSVIVDEDSRPCGQKSLNKDEEERVIPATDPAATSRKLARALSKRYEELRKLNAIDKHRELEDIALGLLNGYWIDKDNDGYVRNGSKAIKDDIEDDNEEDDIDIDGLSCSSSDLFELDHLSLIGNEELPVYESTHFAKDESSYFRI
ncbi:hypothetical protein Ancab_023105 [Ancistrocladus abbreviatus]